ncbi:cytochrome b/b6 domain-containing protein [Aestuariibacter salexigens]|uniref:cytochrome b/b6 domain-containing protein n=1 Tax=Aestuariibacter salexigens TaxID=226010 RepID=UPI00041FFCDE|nr:cytochrome b/b6 domain-containing protein [Aestuariibacter salexigens]
MSKNTLVWDIPTRLFHWLLVLSLITQWLTAEVLDNMDWHFYIGYFTLGLIIFRVVWGVIGTAHARFADLLYSPKNIIAYARGDNNSPFAGHNPLGGLMVILMLVLIGLQAITGLFSNDDVLHSGPYFSSVSEEWQERMQSWHHDSFDYIIAAVVIHIAAVLYYTKVKKQNLVKAMFTGKKDVPAEQGISSSRLLLAVITIALTALFVYWLVEVAPPEPAMDFYY